MKPRNTIQRTLTLHAVNRLKFHPTADEVYQCIIERHPTISRGTVYRNLNLLSEQGEISRVQIPNGADRFDFNTQQHYHVQCKGCGRVFDVDMPYQAELNKKIRSAHGFIFHGHHIVFSGLCPDCQ